FSSRRRHTRFSRDWSSDVCSSDLSMWADDGMVFRLPELEDEPDSSWFVPPASEAHERLTRALGGTALFAAHFRENAARSLLLPRSEERRVGKECRSRWEP